MALVERNQNTPYHLQVQNIAVFLIKLFQKKCLSKMILVIYVLEEVELLMSCIADMMDYTLVANLGACDIYSTILFIYHFFVFSFTFYLNEQIVVV
jgi:hypothetical protein